VQAFTRGGKSAKIVDAQPEGVSSVCSSNAARRILLTQSFPQESPSPNTRLREKNRELQEAKVSRAIVLALSQIVRNFASAATPAGGVEVAAQGVLPVQ
jgi:hypothetical protein